MRTRRNQVLAKPADTNGPADLSPWEERWEQLSDKARGEYLRVAPQLLVEYQYYYFSGPKINERLLAELQSAGLIEPRAVQNRGAPYAIPAAAMPLARKLSWLRHRRPLTRELDFLALCQMSHDQESARRRRALVELARKSKFKAWSIDLLLTQLIPSPRWHELVLDDLKRHPVAVRLIEMFRERQEPLLKAEVPGHLREWPASMVRTALEKLIDWLVLAEELSQRSDRLVVGMSKVARDQWRNFKAWPAERPAMSAAPHPAQVGPANGFLVADLRATLIELLRLPARLKANDDIYVKEIPRFESVLTPLPNWLTEQSNSGSTGRFLTGFAYAFDLGFTEARARDGAAEMHVTRAGQDWLGKSPEVQYADIADWFRGLGPRVNDHFRAPADCGFMASALFSRRAVGRMTPLNAWRLKPEDVEPMRQSFARCFDELPIGEFYPLADFVAHACHGKNNPLRLGADDGRFDVFSDDKPVSPFPEVLDPLAADALKKLILERLIPFGGIQAGWDGRRLLIARQPLGDLYFGRPAAEPRLVVIPDAGKVIVQPDFSILVIGENPASAAELAPFCERKPGPASHGTLHFVLTKSSVVRAAMAGISAQEILARLERHSSVPIPGNVRHEIGEWAGTVCRVEVGLRILIRCPDASAAVRVAALLGKNTERVGETIVAVPIESWTPNARKKLREAGIVLPTDPDPQQRRYRY